MPEHRLQSNGTSPRETESPEPIIAALARISAVYEQSEVVLVGSKTHGIERLNVRGARRDISLDDDLVRARHEILSILASWAALVADERAGVEYPSRSTRELICFLRANASWLSGHPAGADAIAEFDQAAAQAEPIVLGTPGDSRVIELGRCEEPGCGRIVTVTHPDSTGDSKPSASCSAGHRSPPHRWLIISDSLRHQVAQR